MRKGGSPHNNSPFLFVSCAGSISGHLVCRLGVTQTSLNVKWSMSKLSAPDASFFYEIMKHSIFIWLWIPYGSCTNLTFTTASFGFPPFECNFSKTSFLVELKHLRWARVNIYRFFSCQWRSFGRQWDHQPALRCSAVRNNIPKMPIPLNMLQNAIDSIWTFVEYQWMPNYKPYFSFWTRFNPSALSLTYRLQMLITLHNSIRVTTCWVCRVHIKWNWNVKIMWKKNH